MNDDTLERLREWVRAEVRAVSDSLYGDSISGGERSQADADARFEYFKEALRGGDDGGS